MNRVTLILIAAFFTGVIQGQPVYKCPQPDGSIVRQESPCRESDTQPAQPASRYGSSVTESPAWKGLDRIQDESTQTINALTRQRK